VSQAKQIIGRIFAERNNDWGGVRWRNLTRSQRTQIRRSVRLAMRCHLTKLRKELSSR